MARVKFVKKAQASQKTRRCRSCGVEIQPGDAYKYVDKKTGPRSGFRLVWCEQHHPKPSDLASGRTADLLQMTEGFEETLTQTRNIADPRERLSALRDDVESIASDVESFGEEINESAENIEDGFGHETAQSEVMRETASNFEEWSQSWRDLGDDIERRLKESDPESSTYDEDEGPLTEEQVDDFMQQVDDLFGEEPELELTA